MRKYVLAILAAFAAVVAVLTPVSAAPATQDSKILHSFGYKHLLLGMSAEQVEATGLAKFSFTFNSCDFYELVAAEGDRNANVLVRVHRTEGVQVIDATDPMKTLRGIGNGSTLAELQAAYPDLRQGPSYPWQKFVNAPLNADAEFQFNIGFDDTISWMLLQKKNAASC